MDINRTSHKSPLLLTHIPYAECLDPRKKRTSMDLERELRGNAPLANVSPQRSFQAPVRIYFFYVCLQILHNLLQVQNKLLLQSSVNSTKHARMNVFAVPGRIMKMMKITMISVM
jgi:hypothetical protein